MKRYCYFSVAGDKLDLCFYKGEKTHRIMDAKFRIHFSKNSKIRIFPTKFYSTLRNVWYYNI